MSARGPRYHEWTRATPVLGAIGAVVAVASIIIGGYATLFLIGALSQGDTEAAAECGAFFVGIALANGIVNALRHWRQHHGRDERQSAPPAHGPRASRQVNAESPLGGTGSRWICGSLTQA